MFAAMEEFYKLAKKIRLDSYMVQHGLADSLPKAQSLIMAGDVYCGEVRCDTAGQQVLPDAMITVRSKTKKYVSRGGLKLEKAITAFSIDLTDRVAMDVGASTGGFTDCMLQNGARKVYSVDVGYGQLAWKLRNDPRVVNMERTNFRFVTPEMLEEKVQFASVDVSFISLRVIFPVLRALLDEDASICALIKPQFEAAREDVMDGGIVRDSAVHCTVIERVLDWAPGNGFEIKGLTHSPIRGPEGNIEYLVWLKNAEMPSLENRLFPAREIVRVVEEAHAQLDA